jgi:purine-binding chemotaxis protein CheW
MNLRGLIIPVIDVKEKLGLNSEAKTNSSKQRILVAEVSGALTGLLVDEVDQVMRLQTKDVEQAPQGALESYNYISGIAKINEKLVILLDVSSLLGNAKPDKSNIQAVPKETNQTEKSSPKNQKHTENPTGANDQKPSDDIPPELVEVFKEDAEGIEPTQIIREAKTISDL